MSHPRLPLVRRPILPGDPRLQDRAWCVAIVGDIHGNTRAVNRVRRTLERLVREGREPHWILFTGDFTGRDTRGGRHAQQAEEEAVELVSSFRRALPGRMAFVPGNHDPVEIRDTDNLDGLWTRNTSGGLHVSGIGGAGPDRFGWPYEWTESELEAYLEAAFPAGIPSGVILSHSPPFGLLDRTIDGRRVGSQVLREVAERHTGLFVCGHIHESRGEAHVNRCTVVNAGSLGSVHAWTGLVLAEGRDDEWKVTFLEADPLE